MSKYKSRYLQISMVYLVPYFVFSSAAFAQSWLREYFPLDSSIDYNIQVDSNFKYTQLVDGEFDRKNYPFIGAMLYIDGAYESDGFGNIVETVPSAGDSFQLVWRENQTNSALDSVTLTYLGFASNCWSVQWQGWPTESFCYSKVYPNYYFYFYTAGMQCLETGDYRTELFQNGVFKDSEPFRPSEFQPAEAEITLGIKRITPDVDNSGNGEVATIVIKLQDDIVRGDYAGENGNNCGQPIKDRSVTLTNTVQPLSGSHKHFHSLSEPGTGAYIEATPSWDRISPDATEIEAKSDVNGLVVARYQAGKYGVSETVTASVLNTATGQKLKKKETLDIQVTGLVPLDTTGMSYELAGTYGTNCDIYHNDGPNGSKRKSHYVTPRMKVLIEWLNGRYYNEYGHHLSFNDGSLEYGGFFDAGGSDRNQKCHISHRSGKDIDVNKGEKFKNDKTNCEDVTVYSLNCLVETGDYGDRMPRWRLLDRIVDDIPNLQKIPEETLHYRHIDS